MAFLRGSFPVREADQTAAQLNAEQQEIASQCCTHNLLINPGKTKLLLLETSHVSMNAGGFKGVQGVQGFVSCPGGGPDCSSIKRRTAGDCFPVLHA